MDGISVATAMEIFTNPHDLRACIAFDHDAEKFAFTVSRGAGHNHKLLISTTPFADTFDAAISEINSLLRAIKEWGFRAAKMDDDDFGEIEPATILTGLYVDRVLDGLRRNKQDFLSVVDTASLLREVAQA